MPKEEGGKKLIVSVEKTVWKHLQQRVKELGGTPQHHLVEGYRRGIMEPDLDRQRKLDEEVEIRRRLSRDGG